MAMSARALNRATLGRQLLLRREHFPVDDAVRRLVAVQAQHAASPYLALWTRLADFDPAELDAAFADGTLIKATLMRVTLHAVHAEDYPVFHQAVQPMLRAARLNDRRFTSSGLTAADADALVPDLLQFADRPRTSAEGEEWVGRRVAAVPTGVWWALRQYAPLRHAATGAPWSFGARPTYLAAAQRLTSGDPERSHEALQELTRRYLAAFGPASVADLAQYSVVYRSWARAAVEALGGELEQLESPDGTTLYDVPGGLRPDEQTPAPPRLLPMWDSALLAHADRSRIVPAEYRTLVGRSNGDTLPTLLVDGYVAGVWRPVDGGIEATAFSPLTEEAWTGLAAEARGLVALLSDREPLVYRRFDRWWRGLPAAQVRVLPPR